MNTLQIRDTCRKCGHKEVRTIPGQELATDFCALADRPCDEIKGCDPAAKIPRTRHNTRRGVLNLRNRINEEIDRLKQEGDDFKPVDLAKELGLTTKEIIPILRECPDIYLKTKGNAKYYYPSIWAFRERVAV